MDFTDHNDVARTVLPARCLSKTLELNDDILHIRLFCTAFHKALAYLGQANDSVRLRSLHPSA